MSVISKSQLWAARILTGLAISFLLFDAIIKVFQLPPATQGTAALGFATSATFGIGVLELVCVSIYAVPRTSLLGAVLLTGYLGGAIASQVRVGNPLFSHVLFPTYVATLIWVGLYLRDARLRTLVRVPLNA